MSSVNVTSQPLAANRWRILILLCMSLLLVAIDATVLFNAMPRIVEDLQPTSIQQLWIVDVYSLVMAGLLVTTGTLSDRFGRKRFLLAGYVVFGVASTIAAFAGTPEVLIGARALLAVGGALMMPATLSIIRQIFTDPRERSLAISIWGGVASAGAAIGPLMGGALLSQFSWGSVFLINIPILVIIFPLAFRLIRETRESSPQPWDLASALLAMVGLVSLVYAIKEIGKHLAMEPLDALLLVIGIAALTLFVRRQRRLAHPLLDLNLFRNRTFAAAVACAMFSVIALIGGEYFMSQYFQFVRGYSPLQSGFALTPLYVASILCTPLAARAIHTRGARWTIGGGLGIAAIAMAGIAIAERTESLPLLLIALAVLGVGTSFSFAAASDTILSVAPANRAGAAAAIESTSYELGTTLGVALMGTILGSVYARSFGTLDGLSESQLDSARESIGNAEAIAANGSLSDQLVSLLRSAAEHAFLDGFFTTLIVSTILVAATSLFAFMMFPRSSGHPAMTQESGGH